MLTFPSYAPNESQAPDLPSAPHSDSPAILRLKLLETKFVAAGRISDDARQSAHDLMRALKRAIAEKPSLSFADVVAKLRTYDDLSQDHVGEAVDDVQKALLKSALADLARFRPPA
jgi:hypothetical protein